MRAAARAPQLAEQLVEVPTIISYSSLQRTVEQHVDIPVPGGEGPISALPGFSSGQSSTATPSSKKRISERIVEQIVDPVSSGLLLGSLPGQGSSSSHSPAGVEELADEPGEGVFRTFPKNKKSAKLVSHSSPRVPASGSPSTPAAQLEGAPLPDSIEWVQLRERHAGKTYYRNRRTYSTVWQAPAGFEVVCIGERNEAGGSGTGTGIRVSVRMTGAVPPAQGGIQILGAVPSLMCRDLLHREQCHWFCHPRGTLLVLEAITLVQLIHTGSWVYAHFRAVWTTINSLSVSLVVMDSQMS